MICYSDSLPFWSAAVAFAARDVFAAIPVALCSYYVQSVGLVVLSRDGHLSGRVYSRSSPAACSNHDVVLLPRARRAYMG